MQAGLDAGGQSAGLDLTKKLDPAGTRTVGVLTKVDKKDDAGAVRQHIMNTLSAYPLKNGYFAVTPNPHLTALISSFAGSC